MGAAVCLLGARGQLAFVPIFSVPSGTWQGWRIHFPSARNAVGSLGGTRQSVRKDMNMKTFINMLKDQSGASAAEYALILAIVGSALAVAAYGLGNTIAGAMNNAGDRINSCQDGSC